MVRQAVRQAHGPEQSRRTQLNSHTEHDLFNINMGPDTSLIGLNIPTWDRNGRVDTTG